MQAVEAQSPAAPAAAALKPQPRSENERDGKPDPNALTLEDLQEHFCTRTIHETSKEIDVGLTALKRQCRKLGIRRWPFRQVRRSARRTSGHPALGMPCNAHAPRAQLSSIAKMMDEFRKLEEREEPLKPEQHYQQQVRATVGGRSVTPAAGQRSAA